MHDLGGDGPVVLITHATGFCGRAYEPLARLLAAQFHVWAIDFAGHGDSDLPPGGDFAWTGMVGQLVHATRAIASEPLACVIGHSMGAAVALQAAADHPTLFDAAYVFEPAITPVAPPSGRSGRNPMADGARRRQDTFASKAAAMWRYAARPPLSELDAASLAAYVEHGFATLADGSVTLKCTPESEASTFESSAAITIETVATATLPTLCVAGGDIDSPLPAVVPALAAALPNAELRIHRHLGHFGPLQSPALIAEDIRNHALVDGRRRTH
ncbi:MAG: alpha/beta hydrolase fold protein [Mycobacterium sp.]|nr:alpha/beta hydrolase fold protein [Mycobacterium sp.]